MGPGGRATADEKIIGEHAWRLLYSYKFDPKELRGLGIQIQKLESGSASAVAPPGQATLRFPRMAGPANLSQPAAGSSKNPSVLVQPPSSPEIVGDLADQPHDPGPPKQTNLLDLPSFSQVDMGVFDALPPDVRRELEDEYKRRSTSPMPVDGAPPKPPSPPLGARARSSVPPPPLFPQKITVKGTNFKRITRQLAPRSRPRISPQKSMLFQKKETVFSSMRMTDDELRKKDIDPDVFRALPVKVQREQLLMARLIKTTGGIPEPPAERKILKPRKPARSPYNRIWRAPAPRANYRQPPFLRQQGKEKREKLYFTETDDIQQVIEKWVYGYRKWAPKPKDIEFFSKYLVESVDSSKATDMGVERAVAIVKWWLVLLRRYWGGSELIEEEEPDGSQTDRVGQAWWKAFREVKEKMDIVARKRFGGRLSLK